MFCRFSVIMGERLMALGRAGGVLSVFAALVVNAACARAAGAGEGGAAVASVEQYDVYELALEAGKDFENPFTQAAVKAVFSGPDGKKANVEGFYDGGRTWKVRFVPDRLGRWEYSAELSGEGVAVKSSGELACVKGSKHGFLRISKVNPYRFEHDDGTPFYPIGQQLGWGVGERVGFDGSEGGPWNQTDRESFFKAFDGATNLIRNQLGCGTTAGIALPITTEKTGADRYDLDNCRKFDESSRAIKSHGWAQIIILFQDMSGGGNLATTFGDVRDTQTYKTLASPHLPAIERYLRYVVARWGAYADIWELYNEDSYAPNDFLAHLAEVIRRADPYGHPITTNYERGDQAWCQIVCPHEYMSVPAEQVPGHLARDFARFKAYGKPVQYTEFGNKATLSNYDPVKWRVAAWTCFINEGGMLYWSMSGTRTIPGGRGGNSNAYLGAETRAAFRVLADFARGLPVTLRPRAVGGAFRVNIDAWALGDDVTTVCYFHNPAAGYAKGVESASVDIWAEPGRYRARYIDPATGKVVQESEVSAYGQSLGMAIPRFQTDLAARLDRLVSLDPLPAPAEPAGTGRGGIVEPLAVTMFNPYDRPVQARLRWQIPSGMGWTVTTDVSEVELSARGRQSIRAVVRFEGSVEGFVQTPTFTVEHRSGQEVLYVTKPLAYRPQRTYEYLREHAPKAVCRRTDSAPVVDGKLDEGLWGRCEPIGRFVRMGVNGLAVVQTEVRVAYDSNNLYVGIRCREPRMDGLVAQERKRDGAIYKDDSVELFVDPGGPHRRSRFQFSFNALGTQGDARNVDTSWNGSYRAAASKDATGWSVEVGVPWSVLEVDSAKVGLELPLNVCRTRRAESPNEYSQWAPTLQAYDRPELFGKLVLSD